MFNRLKEQCMLMQFGCTHINEGGIDVVSSICTVTRMQLQMTVGI